MKTDQESQPTPPPPSPTPSQTNPSIRGDPATRKFAIFFLSALAIITIGVGIGIGVGNLAHYRYFGPTNITYINNGTNLSQIFDDAASIGSNTL